MAQAGGGDLDPLDAIPQHRPVDLDPLGLGGPLQVGGEEQVGDTAESVERLAAALGVEQIDGDVPRRAPAFRCVAGEGDDLPVVSPSQDERGR